MADGPLDVAAETATLPLWSNDMPEENSPRTYMARGNWEVSVFGEQRELARLRTTWSDGIKIDVATADLQVLRDLLNDFLALLEPDRLTD